MDLGFRGRGSYRAKRSSRFLRKGVANQAIGYFWFLRGCVVPLSLK